MFFKKKNIYEKSAGAVLYPDKIIIHTLYAEAVGSFYTSDLVTILAIEIYDEQIGLLVKDHLQQYVFCPNSKDEKKKIYDNYKRKIKLKTEKAIVENAKYVSIKTEGKFILLNSFQTKIADKIFLGNPDSMVSLSIDIDPITLGNEVRSAWRRCKLI